MALFKRGQVSDYFLNEENPYSKKRTIKVSHAAVALGVIATIVLIVGSIYEKQALKEKQAAQAAKEAQANTNTRMGSVPQAQSQGYLSIESNYFSGGGRGGRPQGARREYSASQLIKRGESAADTLPTGTSIAVQLLGQVESTDSKSPVTAVILENVLSPAEALVIPKGTKVIGAGQLDASRERLQVRFHTLVFPEGQQYGVSGLAAMMNGSSGIAGNFSSGKFRKNVSQFFGTFVGGVAQGLKDRSASGQMGIPVEPGSVKNGVLNGVAESSLNYAKTSSEEMGQGGASIKVKSGTQFLLYLDREFHP